jgi:hypothetical protein
MPARCPAAGLPRRHPHRQRRVDPVSQSALCAHRPTAATSGFHIAKRVAVLGQSMAESDFCLAPTGEKTHVSQQVVVLSARVCLQLCIGACALRCDVYTPLRAGPRASGL